MNLDKLDIFVFEEFSKTYKSPKHSTPIDIKWEIALRYVKRLFPNLEKTDKKKFEEEVQRVYVKIKARLDRYCDHGFFSKFENGDGKIKYVMDLDLIKLGRVKFSDKYDRVLIVRLTKKFF